VVLVKENMIRRFTKLNRLSLTSSTEAEQLSAAINILDASIGSYMPEDMFASCLQELFTCGHVALVARTIDCHDHEVRGADLTF
jgi:hypothetical protein